MNDETRDILTKLEFKFSAWANGCTWRGEYGDGLVRAYEGCAEEIQDILDGITTP